jgi:hypothetical protein
MQINLRKQLKPNIALIQCNDLNIEFNSPDVTAAVDLRTCHHLCGLRQRLKVKNTATWKQNASVVAYYKKL